MTRKQLKEMVRNNIAQDITNAEFEKLPPMDCLGTSRGIYGMNGGLFRNPRTGDLYVILSRNTLLFQLV